MKLEQMNTYELLNLYESFIKADHYEATNEFDKLRTLPYKADDVRAEVARRMNY
jgi:hypothetical protein